MNMLLKFGRTHRRPMFLPVHLSIETENVYFSVCGVRIPYRVNREKDFDSVCRWPRCMPLCLPLGGYWCKGM